MKRIVSLILALSMVLSMFTMSFAGTGLKDIEGQKYEAAVEALMELGVVNGYPDGTYLPNNVVTRAELAKLLVVAYGLEPAAEASKGVTPFSDIESNHWASGYINVSADYKFVNGYPEGTFKGDATVTYAEAITMCLRVLGYANEIDSKGTWPTNYIAKAQDLKLMKDIEFASYNDGAKRGDIALLIWNMLRTKMWTVEGESEGDGLVSAPNKVMLNVKFSDYHYSDEATFGGYSIDPDKKEDKAVVTVTISGDDEIAGTYKYADNDFYKFVPGTEVEVLVNSEDETLLTMVPTGSDKLVEGTIEELDDAEYTSIPASGDYVYARLLRKDIKATSILEVSSEYVEEVSTRTDGIKLNKKVLEYDDYEDEIVIKDGERVTIKEIEEGDVFSTVKNGNETFYVIGSEEAEGNLEFYKASESKMKVDGTEYILDANAKYVEDPEDEDEKSKSFANNFNSDMKNEDVVLILDAVAGKVVRIEFDGNIGDNTKDTTYKFFAITSEVERESSRVYTISLENEDGEDEYTFAKDTKGKELYNSNDDLTGRFAAVKLDEDGKVVDLTVIADADGAAIRDNTGFEYDEEKHYSYIALVRDYAEYNEKKGTLVIESGDRIWNVDESVVFVTLLKDDKDTVNDSGDDVYSVEFSKGLDEVKKLKGESVIVIYDNAEKFDGAKYVIVYDEISDKSNVKAGTVVEYEKNDIGDYEAEILTAKGKEFAITKNDEGLADKKVVVYTTEEKVKNNKTETILTVKATLDAIELSVSGDSYHGYIASGDASDDGMKADITLPNGSVVRYEVDETFKNDYEDLIFVLVEVDPATSAEKADGEGDYVAKTVTVIDVSEVNFEVSDRISGDPTSDEVIFIIRGMDERA